MAVAAPPSTNGQVVLDPIPFGSFETHEFPAGDGRMLNLKHLAPAVQTAREPVLLIAGTCTRANIFNPPTENLLKVLSSKGFDLWILNWRSSIDLPATKYTLGDAAVLDMRGAVQAVKDRTGADTIKAIIHCQGSCAFMMAITVGLIKDVSLVISNSSALHPVMPCLRMLITPHPLGGCNMASAPGAGVTNHMGEVFGYDNLFVMDGSVIPRAIGRNPSKTIAAVAERSCEKLREELPRRLA